MTRAIPICWRMPPESSRGKGLLNSARSIRCSMASAHASRSVGSTPAPPAQVRDFAGQLAKERAQRTETLWRCPTPVCAYHGRGSTPPLHQPESGQSWYAAAPTCLTPICLAARLYPFRLAKLDARRHSFFRQEILCAMPKMDGKSTHSDFRKKLSCRYGGSTRYIPIFGIATNLPCNPS